MSHRVVELHCIMPIENLPSVLERGILSHDGAEKLAHRSVAKQEIQDRRVGKTVPNGLRLHQYANLYFCARNPMLYLRQPEHPNLCVVRINRTVLSTPNAVLSDQNAATDYVRFYPYPFGMERINFDYVFADWWSDENQITMWQKKAAKCAEALIPNVVNPQDIIGFYTCDEQTKQRVETVLRGLQCALPVTTNPHLFFR
ncbi:DUF4433 domain-containing protein [Pseudomonas protegens]|uniref:DUF4433 domain-containing protein n=2 Tax=Pseudomonas protegens TaxID=380021 RepID=UPI000F4A5EEC|nr:hypothetical protein BK639_11745 [Pseudomonas protegens]ROL99379.1 hypothetical protein BK641_21710 [Pseudomonas protegens]ROM05394.1 hypothetical protein BK640_11940 [Pseudomonas protegens]ROM11869.1 hypothetical protein BK642_10585 [Pseudomonas protegens]